MPNAADPKRQNPSRQDTWELTMSVHTPGSGADGAPYGIWDKKTGGELDSDEVKYYPGNMAPPLTLGGKVLPGNVTLQRDYDRNDEDAKIQTLFNGVGKYRCDVSQQPLDFDGNPYGHAIQWSGILKKVQVPDVDSEGNAAALVEVEISVDGVPSRAN